MEEEVGFREKTTGFEQYEFVHCALPEMDSESVSSETEFLGKTLSFPLIISAMTGGFDGASEINRMLARAAQEFGVALSVGSQRQVLENEEYADTYSIVRSELPDGVVIGNIGAAELPGFDDFSPIQRMVDLIEADAMAVHLNPLQEVLQPEGDARFAGVLDAISRLVTDLPVPVIVKEVGCGLSEDVARQLVSAGVEYIDVAGAGGTSWVGIESFRGADEALSKRFWDWGIPTAESLIRVTRVKGTGVIASGGIDDGVTMAKALALGADICGSALPLLKAVKEGGVDGLIARLKLWERELRVVQFLTGSRRISDLRREGNLYRK